MIDSLQLRDNAKNQLLEIKDIESGVDYLNKVKAIEVWARAEKKDAELQNLIAEQKIRTQRILGKLIREGQERGDVASQGDRVSNVPTGNISTINEIGISRKQSSAFKQIASIPDETFEQFIAEKKQAVNDAVAELTTSGAVRLARSLKEKEHSIDIMQDVSMEIEIQKLAKHINLTYTQEQRKTLVSLIKI